MSEPIAEARPIDHEAVPKELQTVNGELRSKYAKAKQRIAELESSKTEIEATVTAKDAAISQLQTTVRQITIDGPLRQMAEDLSTAPELWLEQFSKSYKLEMLDGKLTVLTSAGEPTALPFEPDALAKHLTGDTFAQSKNFRAITIVSRASGAGTVSTQHQAIPSEAPKRLQFGLR